MILKAIRAGVGFGSGPETTFTHALYEAPCTCIYLGIASLVLRPPRFFLFFVFFTPLLAFTINGIVNEGRRVKTGRPWSKAKELQGKSLMSNYIVALSDRCYQGNKGMLLGFPPTLRWAGFRS